MEEIDDVLHALETANSDEGDVLAFAYEQLLEVATAPRSDSGEMNRALLCNMRLMESDESLRRILGQVGLFKCYQDVIDQVHICISQA